MSAAVPGSCPPPCICMIVLPVLTKECWKSFACCELSALPPPPLPLLIACAVEMYDGCEFCRFVLVYALYRVTGL